MYMFTNQPGQPMSHMLQLSLVAAAHRADHALYPTYNSFEKPKTMSDEEFSGLLSCIKSGKITGTLELRDKGLDNDHVKQLVKVLLTNEYITGLNFSKNQIDDRGVQILLPLIKNNSNIKMINLAGNSFSKESIRTFLGVLETNYTVIAMDVGFACPALENILVRNQQIGREMLRYGSYKEAAEFMDSQKIPKVLSNIILSYYSETTLPSAQKLVHEHIITPALNFVYNHKPDQKSKPLNISSKSKNATFAYANETGTDHSYSCTLCVIL